MLIGEMLDLRPVTAADAKLLTEWFNDPEYLGPFFNVTPHSEAEVEKNLSSELPRRTSLCTSSRAGTRTSRWASSDT